VDRDILDPEDSALRSSSTGPGFQRSRSRQESISNPLPFPAAKLGLKTVIDQLRDLLVISLEEMKPFPEQLYGFSSLPKG
jgi:hypothetical protein